MKTAYRGVLRMGDTIISTTLGLLAIIVFVVTMVFDLVRVALPEHH